MMTRITLTIYPEEREALQAMARQERRHPREQAAMLLRKALEENGYLLTFDLTPQPQEAGREPIPA